MHLALTRGGEATCGKEHEWGVKALVLLRLQDCAAIGYSSARPARSCMGREQNTNSPPPEDLTQPETKGKDASLLTQHSIFQASGDHDAEFTETLVRIEGCQVINPRVVREWVEKKHKKKAWACTFASSPDLWSQEADAWIQAVTENTQDIAMLNKLKLNNGDMCTVIGI